MPKSRTMLLCAVVTAFAVALYSAPNWTPAASASHKPSPLAGLRKQAEKSRKDLQRATKTYVKHRSEFKRAIRRLHRTRAALKKTNRKLAQVRVPLARLANAQYQSPVTDASSLMASSTPDNDIQSAADVYHLTRQHTDLVVHALRLHKKQKHLATSTSRQLRRVRRELTSLKREVRRLRKKANASVDALIRKAIKLGLDPGIQISLGGCNPHLARFAAAYPNGLIPRRYLCRLPQRPYMLRPDAAEAFFKLNAAYKQHFGHQMCVNAAYRSMATQRMLYQEKPPGYAAVPGTSNHGKGLAVDLCGGVQSEGSVQFNWLRANSTRFGWTHPAWAYSGPFEPWHWEYGHESSNGQLHD